MAFSKNIAFILELPIVNIHTSNHTYNIMYLIWTPCRVIKRLLPSEGSVFRSPYYLVRVPVTVKDDHRVCALQVESETPRPGAQQEDEVL